MTHVSYGVVRVNSTELIENTYHKTLVEILVSVLILG